MAGRWTTRLAAAALCATLTAAYPVLAQPAANAALKEALVAQESGDFDTMLAALDRALAAPDATNDTRAMALRTQADIQFFHFHRLEPAIKALDRLVVLFPGDADYRILRASYRLTAGQVEQALPDIEAALTLAPDSWSATTLRGRARLGRIDIQRIQSMDAAMWMKAM
ncbi:MAG: Tetratricopeptide repeat [Caulobacter sp.]|nr:Tetratricopeptide repeat [Caulobacter sp.]